MDDKNLTTLLPLPRLIDNRFGNPEKGGYGKDISSAVPEVKNILSKYGDRTLDQWSDLGVAVFSGSVPCGKPSDDGSHELSLFTLGHENCGNTARTWINTHNCMGVVRLRDKETAVQIEIGSRFDEGRENQLFLTYLLSKVFGGSISDPVYVGTDSLWKMLLAFHFRHRLIEASAMGLFKKYRTFHHNDSRVRGKIDVNEHLRRNIPFYGNIAYATHEITFDNPTNHLIRYALAKVGREWGGLLTGDNRLTDVRHQLEQNTPSWQASDVISCIRHKENRTPIKHPYFHAQYEPLRQVSLAILRDEGASLYQQQQEAEGVIFDGSWLWEEYLWTLLKPLGFEHPENKKQERAWNPLDGVRFYPDFFHRKKRIVLDAKYKRGGVNQDDAKQVFAYMFLLDAVNGGLIKPDEDKDAPINRNPQAPDAKPAKWYNFHLPPPSASKAGDLVKEMTALEGAFRNKIDGVTF